MKAPPVRIAVVAMAIFGILVMGLGIAHVNRRQEVVRLGYELSRAIDELSKAQEENRRLRLEKSALTNPERIRRLATALGMGPPGPEQIRVIQAAAEPDDAFGPVLGQSAPQSEPLARTAPVEPRRE